MPLLITVIVCVVCCLLGRFQEGAYAMNGNGTVFYGSEEPGPDAITTKWLTTWGLPVLPIRSYKLVQSWPEPSELRFFHTSEKMRVQPLPGFGLKWDQIGLTWLKMWGIAVLILGAMVIIILWWANRPHRTLFW
jgi:hypothetical protein